MKHLPAGTLLGQNVRRLRQQQGWAAGVLAARLGWTVEKLQALEAGTLDLDLDSIDLLSAALTSSQRTLFDASCEDTEHFAEQRYG